MKTKNTFDEDKALGILFANFSSNRKVHDWIYLSEKVRELSDFYGSYKKLAEKIHISSEVLREVLKLQKLSKEVRDLVKKRELDFEVAWRIASVKDFNNQIKLANAVKDLPTHDGRYIVRIYKNNPSLNLRNFVQKFKDSKNVITNLDLMILPLEKEKSTMLKKESKTRKISPSKLISEIIIPEWFKNKK